VHAAARSIPLTLVMPANVTEERRAFVRALGATIIDSPADQGSNGAVVLARAMAKGDTKYVMPDQYSNQANPKVHEVTTAPEILTDLPEVDVVVAGLGTGGTATGLARYFAREKPSVKIWAAEPMPGEKVTGLRSLEDGFTPEVMETELLAGRVLVNSRDSIIAARALARSSGILAGPSTGATLAVALRVARDAAPNSNIVFIACDAGWKYFSAGLGDGNLDEMEDALEGDVFWW
jgi:cysteine synthase B